MKNLRRISIIFILIFCFIIPTQAFAVDNEKCISMLGLASSPQNLGKISANLIHAAIQMTLEAKRTGNFSQLSLYTPIGMVGSQALLASTVMAEFNQLVRSDAISKEPDMFGKIYNLITTSLTIFYEGNELFLSTIEESVISAPTNNYKKILSEVQADIQEINKIIVNCKK
jgi:hypothetical protein